MSRHMPFQGIPSFLKAPNDPNRSYRFFGLPFDMASTNRPGSALGPNAIRQASLMLTDGIHPHFENDPSEFIADVGDAAISSADINRALIQIEDFVYEHSQNALPVIAGGNHLVTLGVLRALHKIHGQMGIIHFDAHSDVSHDHFGDPIGHGTWLYNAICEKLVDPKRTISVGLRAPVAASARHWLRNMGGTSLYMTEIRSMDLSATGLAELIIQCSEASQNPTYLTFDIDSLDPAYAPGTGTPEIGGFTTGFVLDVLSSFWKCSFVGMDVVEVNPMLDNAQITALAAATIMWHFVAMHAAVPVAWRSLQTCSPTASEKAATTMT